MTYVASANLAKHYHRLLRLSNRIFAQTQRVACNQVSGRGCAPLPTVKRHSRLSKRVLLAPFHQGLGARQGPFVYMFDASALPASPRPSVSAWVSWAGVVPGTAVSTVAAGTAPSEVLTRLDSAIGAPPAVGWIWQVMRRTTGPADVAEDSTSHGNFWVFYVLKGSTEVGIGDRKEVLEVGEATLIPERQAHTHRFPAQSEVLGFHVRPSDRPPGDSHRGQLLFTSEETIEAPAANHSVRVREFTLARGEQKEANIGTGPFAYVIEGTLSTRSGNIVSTTGAGNVLGLPGSGTVVVSNEGTAPLKFILVDLQSEAVGIRPLPAEVVAPSAVRVVVPDPDNLEYLNFWVALGAGFFKEEGLDVQVVTPPGPPAAVQFLLQGRAEVALLPPPLYLPAIAQRQPFLIFANLLQNDQINLVVRKEVAEARKLSPTAPLAERLKGIQGLRVGVAHGPPPRLRALFSSVGMDADRDIEMVILGQERFQAFAGNPVDALYAHTPFLEKALVEQGAVVLVDQLRGEVPELAGLNIHSLVTSRAFAAANPRVLVAMTRAIYQAQQLIHSDLKASASALLRSGVPGVELQPVETTLTLYEPAVPKTPEVSITAIERTNKYFWGPRDAPEDLSAINLSDYVAPQFAEQVVGG